MTYKFTLILLVFNSFLLIAQPRLEITPDDIEFEDIFHRNKNVLFINTGDDTLRIDSLVYRNYYYFLRFDKPWEYPVFLQPNDTLKMDCILESHVYVPATDTTDTLFIYSNGLKPLEKLKIKIKYYDDDYRMGYLAGQITDGGTPVDSAHLYFFYNNNYIIKSVVTDQNGLYNVSLPPGLYAIAVEKDSYYVSFYNNQYDPFNADLISLQKDSTKTINIQMDKMSFTGNSISGIITDSITLAAVKKGVIVVRTGTHTPNKISSGVNSRILLNGIYTAFIKSDGSYNIQNVIVPGHYFVQAFSDYYMPAYYNFANKSAVFWQQADSIYISGSLSNVNVVMARDSSVGGGRINGTVTVNSQSVNLSDVMVLAKSTDYNLWYNYGFLKDNNEFKLTNLPYGNYKLFAQKIGFNDGESTDLQITQSTKEINGVNIQIIITSAIDEKFLPDEFTLYQNFPNPFNPVTKIRYAIPSNVKRERSNVMLKVYDILGNEVATLVNEEQEPGYYEVEFSTKGGSASGGNALNIASGVYFYRLTSGRFVSTKKMLMIK
ncbi:MAG: hypothetical protein A2315_02435 [Ignavibacteria bacterium RIFOXYB2_FULL_35_12]|nr:MAG: hypothetical protein A2006_12675 [Ignavibacteria bacterium GWC2_35_8]OGU57374.1 MAG: hypothetical protein A2X60_16415 [Ignavibacteria bacterium GWF2_35_20]OGU78603.1 MAG: hypothetical protein A2254_07325 [Ignavibacteria bacterium RIFOXYA2_FULL_35_9]OGU88311.1 MAG: hypothetical protein A2492_08450 [Ignavibacteria bacterium RIFOXYC12_FULL_35_11]OGU91620.1 MAG: hypothetical protein A3K31_02925 [Ignavibacteria bacterium RIFOXYA12_FULL_35_25]OGU97838.1 MAG: hypothetical protein A2347_16355 